MSLISLVLTVFHLRYFLNNVRSADGDKLDNFRLTVQIQHKKTRTTIRVASGQRRRASRLDHHTGFSVSSLFWQQQIFFLSLQHVAFQRVITFPYLLGDTHPGGSSGRAGSRKLFLVLHEEVTKWSFSTTEHVCWPCPFWNSSIRLFGRRRRLLRLQRLNWLWWIPTRSGALGWVFSTARR